MLVCATPILARSVTLLARNSGILARNRAVRRAIPLSRAECGRSGAQFSIPRAELASLARRTLQLLG